MTRKIRLTFEEGTSSKFWELAQDGATLTKRWGRIGTAGQEKAKDYASEAAATKDYDKDVAGKMKEGYREDGAASTSAPAAAPKPAVTPKSKAKSSLTFAAEVLEVEEAAMTRVQRLLSAGGEAEVLRAGVIESLGGLAAAAAPPEWLKGWDKGGSDPVETIVHLAEPLFSVGVYDSDDFFNRIADDEDEDEENDGDEERTTRHIPKSDYVVGDNIVLYPLSFHEQKPTGQRLKKWFEAAVQAFANDVPSYNPPAETTAAPVSLPASGRSSVARGDLGRSGHFPTTGPRAKPSVLWISREGTPGTRRSPDDIVRGPAPLVAGDAILTLHDVDPKGKVIFNNICGRSRATLTGLDGRQRWTTELPVAPKGWNWVDCEPCVDNDVAFCCNDAGLTALALETGKVLWEYKPQGTIDGAPIVVGDWVCVPTQKGVVGVDRAKGRKRWLFDGKTESRHLLAKPGGLAARGGTVYVSTDDHAWGIVALDAATGGVVWKKNMDDEPGEGDMKIAYESCLFPVLDGDCLVVVMQRWNPDADGPKKYALAGLDAATGAQRWKAQKLTREDAALNRYGAIAVADGRVVGVSYDDTLRAYTLGTGQQVWSSPLPGKLPDGSELLQQMPIIAGGVVYFVGYRDGTKPTEGFLCALSLETGEMLWRLDDAGKDPKTAKPIRFSSHTAPAVHNGVLYIQSTVGLVALK